mmetsp:Transcript_58064/g.172715  ORF Transcript_58064/g.172715 Transcript_58064/m.172715 type:complete len:229 (+) Transcript_58064:544-1230(+)
MAHLHAGHEDVNLGVVLVLALKDAQLAIDLRSAGQRDIAVSQVDHHVRADGLRRLLVRDVLGGREAHDPVDVLQLSGRLLADEVLERHGESGQVREADAHVVGTLLEAVLDVGRNPVLQRARRLLRHLGDAVGLQAADVPAVLLHEEAVEHVAHGLVVQEAKVVLRKRGEDHLQLALDFEEPLWVCAPRQLLCEGPLHVLPPERLSIEEALGLAGEIEVDKDGDHECQ